MTELELPCGYWDFIELYLPDYYHRNDVLKSDIFTRYLDGEEVLQEDIDNFFANRSLEEIEAEYKQNETDLFTEAYENFAQQNHLSLDSWHKALFLLKDILFESVDANFIYRVIPPDGTTIDCDSLNAEIYCDRGKIAGRFARLKKEIGCQIIFEEMQSTCLDQNLKAIDFCLPQLLAKILLICLLNKEYSLRKCVETLTEQNPFRLDIETHPTVYEYKVMRFLQECALGMKPDKPWHGLHDTIGDPLIVKENDDIICLHLNEHKRFMEYLLYSATIEFPSTYKCKNRSDHPCENTENKFSYGYLYQENGNYFIKLNLNIRFK